MSVRRRRKKNEELPGEKRSDTISPPNCGALDLIDIPVGLITRRDTTRENSEEPQSLKQRDYLLDEREHEAGPKGENLLSLARGPGLSAGR